MSAAQRTAFRGPRHAVAALVALTLGALGSAGGCSSTEACMNRDCPAGQRCTQDRCSAPCSAQSDCPLGENCALWQFPDGEIGNFCVTLDYAKDGRTGQYEPCASDAECDTLRGWFCLDGECRRPCRSHPDCAGIGYCDANADGVAFCVPEATAPALGGFGTRCPNGTECAEGFACRGVGAGDFNAYCTTVDCTSDAECGVGMRCIGVRTARQPCVETCGLAAAPAGSDCVPLDEIGPGLAFRCGPLSLMRNACVYRELCDSCETNADCLGSPDQVCARDSGGNKICTVRCDPALSGCPWGNAMTCAVTDESLGFATCSHRFGSCRGSGASCEPCVWDDDCGANGVCVASSFTGERFCLDFDVTCSCEGAVVGANGSCVGGGCPTSPGGISMSCLDTDAYAGTSVHATCFGASVSSTPLGDSRTGCWPSR